MLLIAPRSVTKAFERLQRAIREGKDQFSIALALEDLKSARIQELSAIKGRLSAVIDTEAEMEQLCQPL